jgi:hypothetical protein
MFRPQAPNLPTIPRVNMATWDLRARYAQPAPASRFGQARSLKAQLQPKLDIPWLCGADD